MNVKYLAPRWGCGRPAQISGLFNEFFRGFDELASIYQPRMDVAETDKEIRVSVELPGVTENDVQVDVSENVLTIHGEKRSEQEEQGKHSHRVERSYGSFCRAIELPTEVNQEKVEAVFKQGVLTVTLTKSEQAQPRSKHITVKVE